jgi:hypothetical protein
MDGSACRLMPMLALPLRWFRLPLDVPPTLSALALLAAGAALAGCSGGQTGGENVDWGCLPVETTHVALDETTPLGFSAAEVLAYAAGERELSLQYEGDDATTVTLTVAVDGDAAHFEEREWRAGEHGTLEAPAIECGDALLIPLTVHFASADGQFAEQWSVLVQAEEVDRAQAHVRLEPDDLDGDLDVMAFATEDFDTHALSVDLVFEPGGVHGVVTGYGDTYHGDAVSHTQFPIATFDQAQE